MLNDKSSFLVTGVAGFIGSALVKRLLKNGNKIVGLDNMNNYYDKSLKESRLRNIELISSKFKGKFTFYKCSLEDKSLLESIFVKEKPDIVVHLAAQAGVRYSIDNPNAYFQSNLIGFGNILESLRKISIKNFIFASSSSVYGESRDLPFKEDQFVDKPVSLYAATKKSNELLAYSYSHLYKLPTIGLRFFTVYGPWGRPDMAPYIFLESMLLNKTIKIYNYGKMRRDFTYIDDVIEGLFRCCFKPVLDNKSSSYLEKSAPFKIFNIGNGNPIQLMDFIKTLESKLGFEAIKEYLPIQKGDVIETFADTSELQKWINFYPETSIEKGLDEFINWYKSYHS
ncbi:MULTISPECIES: NAD-dependent epimerase/dehydratase family protein [Prochlorococcus]|uniref:Putative nucleotide sugar epimerase n=1 Tax=Prochlorococcus marinus str. MIT 9116 TaxID=167544 RepID=A0A0A1ZXT7_PROMR|nr:NAD-dependent epimerase/dehydratase family protein [Prochlorococcus marinus]KGF91967.1 putative nucleotide sugar epimerase [Prochlorococcus marinus str. MIT 9107]KGF93054.1 putative nucleotide sugar epimerase [Prochlorococcus marinus str. MIT 9116]KGF93988.1 putative nucleotide sugar epimerase [Prochlorococcus marinus str. MIT 9123]